MTGANKPPLPARACPGRDPGEGLGLGGGGEAEPVPKSGSSRGVLAPTPDPSLAGRENQNGFTLIEMVVAVFIFGLLSLAGVAILRSSIDVQGAATRSAKGDAGVMRARALIGGDLAQAVARPTRNTTGGTDPTFTGGAGSAAGGFLFVLVRGGVANPSDLPRPDLQKAGYLVEGGALKRVAWPQLDGAQPGPAATILPDVASVATRFRGLDGNWSDGWTPARGTELPRAVELTVQPVAGAPLRLVFHVGGDPAPPPVADTSDAPTQGVTPPISPPVSPPAAPA